MMPTTWRTDSAGPSARLASFSRRLMDPLENSSEVCAPLPVQCRLLPRCTASTYPTYSQGICLRYVQEQCENRPISLTVDETPDLRGRLAVAVLVTFFDFELLQRKTFMADLQVIQKCNAVAVGVLVQEVLEKIGKSFRDVCVLSSDSASYMHKLHRDLQLSQPDFIALHFKDPCHLLNVTLAEGMKLVEFDVIQDFVVHFPALLKSSREVRRKFNVLCQSMNLEPKCLSSVCPSRLFSFYEALADVLHYWRPILSFLKSSDAVGEKCRKLKALVSDPESSQELLIRMTFIHKTLSSLLAIMKVLVSEKTLVHEVYSLLSVKLACQQEAMVVLTHF